MNAVAATGIASVDHHVAIHSPTPATSQASRGIVSCEPAVRNMSKKKAGPNHKPICLTIDRSCCWSVTMKVFPETKRPPFGGPVEVASDATYSVFSEAHTKVNVHVATIVRVSISEVTEVAVGQWRALISQVLNTQSKARSRVTHIEAVIKGRIVGRH